MRDDERREIEWELGEAGAEGSDMKNREVEFVDAFFLTAAKAV
jgi:hypothetical protein